MEQDQPRSSRPQQLRKSVSKAGKRAADSLGTFLKVPVTVQTLKSYEVPILKLAAQASHREDVVVGVHFSISASNVGSVLFVIPRQDACRIANILNGKRPGATKVLDEYDLSILREAANIMAGAYLAALSDLFSQTLIQSVPYLAIDRWRSILDSLLPALFEKGRFVVVFETNLRVRKINARCDIIFFLDKASS
jgi:chemotaxis protein CheY-P-specific phosphatase CheC